MPPAQEGTQSLNPALPAAAGLRGFVQRHRFLLSFALLSAFMGTSVGLAKVTTTLYAMHLGASGWMLGAVAAAQSFGILFMSLPVGFWVERFGPARLFIAGSFIVGLIYVVVPLVPHAVFLLVMTALISFVMPLRFVSLNMVFMTALERIGEGRAGWYRGTHMSGMFLVGPLMAAGVVQAVGHAGSYWLIAAMFFITIALSPLVLSQHVAVPRPAGARVPMRQAVQALFDEPIVRRVALQEGAIQAVHMYYAFYIVVIAVQQLGLSAASAGTLVAVQGASFVGALFLLGGVVTYLGPRVVRWAVTLIALASAVLALAPSAAWLWGGGALLGVGLGLLQIHTLTQFARIGARLGRGRVSGLSALVGPGGGLVGGLLGGTLGVWIGLQPVFLLFVPVFLVLGWSRQGGHEPLVQAAAPHAG